MTATLFLEPLDVLYLRGNKLFADAGAHGEALMPPWPSLAAGAIRSRLMADGASLEALADFHLTHFGLARLTADGKAEILWPLPGDIVVTKETLDDARYLSPSPLPAGVTSSCALPRLPALCSQAPAKPAGGLWLNEAGVSAWLAGQAIAASHLIPSHALWQSDPRLGIALDADKSSAAVGKIYTSECIALQPQIGFAAAYRGAARLADGSLVRLGGDGRGALLHTVHRQQPDPDWDRIGEEGRFRLLLTTPGMFAAGWQPEGVPARLVAAAVGRYETVSGWDVRSTANRPKAAQRVAPSGSVYWYDEFHGDLDQLKHLASAGLAPADPTRHAEGFGKLAIAPWAV